VSNNADLVMKRFEQKMREATRRLPRRLAAEMLRYTDQRFREQGWDGKPWRQRKPGAKNNTGRALLMNRGRLRRSVRITRITDTEIVQGSDVPYARIHNEGFNGSQNVKAHNRSLKFKAQYTDLTQKTKRGKWKVRTAKGVYETKVKNFTRRMRMPRRQFMGDSPYLSRNLGRIIEATLKEAVKQL